MLKTHNRIIAGVLSVLFTGQIALFGDGTSKGILHPDTIAYAAESIKEKKTEKELADEFEQAVSELGQVDYFGDTDVVTGSRLLKSARGRSANSDPMDDVSSSLTVSGIVSLGEVSEVTRYDDPPIYIRIYTGDWQELTHQTVHNGESYNVSIEGGYSDVYHVKYECDGYLPFYLKDYGTGSFVVGSNGSHDTVTLVPGDTTYNANDNNQWSDDNLTSDDANYVSSCLHAVKGASDYLDWMDMDGDGTISQSDVNEIQAMYINMDEDSISVPSNISAYDLNNDNVINTNDFTDFANYLDNVITTLPGVWDINGDSSINADDYTAYCNFFDNSDNSDAVNYYNMDLNHDGFVDSDDQEGIEYYANLPKRSDNYHEYMDKNNSGEIDSYDVNWFESAYNGDLNWDNAFKKYLRLEEGAYFPYSYNLHDTDLDLNGHTLAVNEYMSFNTNIPQFWANGVAANLDVNAGFLYVGKNLVFRTASPDGWDTVPGQTLNINGGTVYIGECFDFGQMHCKDQILMTNANDELIIYGPWTYATDANMEGKWTAGQIHFYGDHWNVNEPSGAKAIYSSGTHSIEFLNPNGLQTILWANEYTYLDDDGNTQTGRRFNFDYVDDNGNCLGVIFPYGYSPELYWFRPWFRTNEEELTAYRKAWEGPDGVHAATGNYKKSFEDYSVTTPGVGVDFVRSYNSTNPEEGSFGIGWDFNIDVSKIITNSYSNYIQVVLPDGSNTTFEKLGANNFRCVNAHSTLEEMQVGDQYEYTVTNVAQSQYHFNTNGELDWIKDANGNRMLISSIENNKRTVTDSINRKYYIYYTGNADHRRITKIEDESAHKKITYEYDENNRLIAATNVKGGRECYFYDENGKLNRIENCFGETTLNVTYIDNGRVDNTVNEHGLKQVYVYDRENCQTGMEEYDGSKLLKKVTYEYDEDYAIVANHTIVDGTEYTDRTEYYKNSEGKNKYDEVKKATDVSGNITEYEYDSNGNVTKVINPDGTFTVTSYNNKNMPLVEVDEMKNVTIYEYDSTGVNVKRKGSSIHPVDNAYALASDNSFSFGSVILDDYAVTEYDYYDLTIDESTRLAGLIRATTDPEGNVTENTYNSNGLVASTIIKDSDGNICSKTTFEYTDTLQPSEVREVVSYNADGSENTTRTTYEYDNFNNITKITTYGTGDDGIVVSYDYDELGRKTAEYTPKYSDKSVGSTYTFNRGNLPSTVTDALGNVTTFEYDAYGNLVKTTNPDGSISITEYDALQREKATYFQDSASSPKQIISRNEYEYVDSDFTVYNGLENYETRHIYGLKERSYAYITANKQVVTETLQDFRGNTVSESVNGNVKRTCNYYANGVLARQTDALGNITKYEYGFLGALTKTYTPFNKDENGNPKYAVSEIQYDKNGNVIKTIDPINEQDATETKNSITESKYDSVGNLIEVRMIDSETNAVNITKYEYDMLGNVTKQYTGLSSDADNDYVLTEYEYDQYLRPISSHDSTGYVSGTTEYDINGNVIRSTDPNGNITVNTYDDLDRLTRSVKTDSNGNHSVTTSYQFDRLGRTISSSVGNATTTYEYDKLGRVVSETDSNGTFKGYFYEGISDYVSRTITGRRHLLLYSDVSYQYDDEMRVSSISESSSQIVSYEYDANGNRSKEILANGISTEYAYNCINAVTEIRSFNGENEIASTTYKYYLDGSDSRKIVTENNITETTSYIYNGFGQLTEEKVENASLTDKYNYSYDDYGNRVSMTATGSEVFTTVYNYKNAQNQYTALLQSETKTGISDETDTEETEITAYTYDNNGNQLSKISNEKTENFTYNVLDQVIGYSDGESVASYTYNADGLRSSKTVNGHTTKHVWDGNQNIIADITDDSPYTADCYFFGAGITASYNFSSGVKSDYNYYRKNAHGDVVSITNSSANNIKTYRYDAFGVEKNLDESDTNAFRYCGEYYDAETGSIYLRARYYDPSIGRFISRDSYGGEAADPLSLNRYTYCHNNPILNFDPTGHSIRSSLSKAWGSVKQWGKDRADDWKTGIGILENSNPAGKTFASYSHGVVDTLGSQISAIRHPVKTAKSMISGVKSLANDPVGSVKGMAIEKYNSLCSLGKDIYNGNWQSIANKAAYSLGGASVAVVEGAIGKAAMAKAPAAFNKVKCTVTGKGCFVAGTIVATIYGGKAIETIEVGDKVLATDPETGETAYKEVLKTYTYVKDTLVYIEANGEIIETTKEHPFWVEGQGWTKAKFLNDGDLLRDAKGDSIVIDKIEIASLPENQYTIVYNFEVADYHTYYVSDDLVLVHNDCGPCGKTLMLPDNNSPTALLETKLNFTGEIHDHHIIPKFRGNSKPYTDFIAKRGIDVDKYTISVTAGKGGAHMNLIHGKGKWNPKWMEFIDNNPSATAKDIYQFAGQMMDDYGLNKFKIHPWGEK